MDINTRTSKIIDIFKKLNELNLGISCFEEFNEFRSICNEFIKSGDPVKGKIKVVGTKRIICYDFGENLECFLKYDETV
jgi:hypothetical protein